MLGQLECAIAHNVNSGEGLRAEWRAVLQYNWQTLASIIVWRGYPFYCNEFDREFRFRNKRIIGHEEGSTHRGQQE